MKKKIYLITLKITVLLLYSLIFQVACLPKTDDDILRNIIEKKVDFKLVGIDGFPANEKFLAAFNDDGFYFPGFPDGGVFKTLYNYEFEIFVPYHNGFAENIYEIDIVNSYIQRSAKEIDKKLLLPKLENLYGQCKYEQISLDVFDYEENKCFMIEAIIPSWVLYDRKIYLFGNTVAQYKRKDLVSNCFILVKSEKR